MAAVEPRKNHSTSDELDWLEFSEQVDLSAASVWVPDYEEDDEITLQGKRVEAPVEAPQEANHIDIEHVPANVEEVSSQVKTARQVRILDESQVLSGEASFATVSLNQRIEESIFESREPIASTEVEGLNQKDGTQRARLLEESEILAGEASYATVMIGERLGGRSHSPIAEFLEKTRLTRLQMMLCGLLVVSVMSVAVIVVLNVSTSERAVASSVPQTETVSYSPPPTPTDAAKQTGSTSSASAIEPAVAPTSPAQVSGVANLAGVTGNVEGMADVARLPSNEVLNSEESRNTPASNPKSDEPVTPTLRESVPVAARVASRTAPVEKSKKLSGPVANGNIQKRSAIRPPAVSVRSNENKEPSGSSPGKTESAPAPTINAVEKIEMKALPVTGGGERPRTVTRRVNP